MTRFSSDDAAAGTQRIAALASSWGWTHDSALSWPEPVPIGMSSSCFDVVRTVVGPSIAWGNTGEKYWISDSGKPGRRGYIAVRHDLDLPDLYLRSTDAGALTVTNLAARGLARGLAVFNAIPSAESDPEPGHGIKAFERRSVALAVPASAGFVAHGDKNRAAQGRELLTGESLELLSWVSRSFDVEVHGEWLVAHCNYGDVSTDDPQIWAWVLSVTSRLLDVLDQWGPEGLRADSWARYTSERIERPTSRDGVLSGGVLGSGVLGGGRRPSTRPAGGSGGGEPIDARPESPVAAMARARGLSYLAQVDHADLVQQNLAFEFGATDVASSAGEPRVQFGNGATTTFDDAVVSPRAKGYVALAHPSPTAAALPHLYLRSTVTEPRGARDYVALAGLGALGIASLVAGEDSTGRTTAKGPKKFERLKVPRTSDFRVLCETARRPDGQQLLTAPALELLGWLAETCDVELHHGWLIAWSNRSPVVTDQAAMWDWSFSVASALADLAIVWGAPANFAQDWACYTTERGKRPEMPSTGSRFWSRSP